LPVRQEVDLVSLRHSKLVWEHSQARGNALVVLLALAEHANDSGVAWPSVGRLARMARVSRRSAFRCLSYLVNELREVARLGPTSTGPRATTRYKLLLPTGAPSDASEPHVTSDRSGTKGMTAESLDQCQPRHRSGDSADTQTIREPSCETSEKKGEENAPRAQTRAASPCSRETATPAEEIQRGPGAPGTAEPPDTTAALVTVADPEGLRIAWNRHAPHLIPCKGLTKSRVQLARARLAEHPALATWITIFETMDRSPFMRGENQWHWKGSFDWLVKSPDHVLRVLEGKYDHHESPSAAERQRIQDHIEAVRREYLVQKKPLTLQEEIEAARRHYQAWEKQDRQGKKP
jgi:hypothetical protein